MVIGFLNFSQTMLCKEPKVEDKAYPTPRSWHKVSDLLNSGISDEDVIAGTIGKGAASEFFNYIEVYKDLPDIKKILAGEKIKMPKSPSVLYALSSSLVVRANEKNIDNIFKFSEGMLQEFHILTIRDIVRKDDDAKTFKAYSRYQQWLNKYSRFYDDDSEETTEE